MLDKNWVSSFEKPKTSPNSLEPSTTLLSPYISHGCLSVKLFYYQIKEIYKKNKKHSDPPVSLLGFIINLNHYY